MLYALLRALSSVSLRWFYSRIDAEGLDRIPPGPVLLAVNHPNAMVDALVVGQIFPRRILFTGRATLFKHPLLAALLRAAGVVPLIRAKDIAEMGSMGDTGRNEGAFDELTRALGRGGAVMIFPEGVTGDRPQLAPIKTGAARIALRAREAGVSGLTVLPIGLTFERKDVPRTRVFVQVGRAIPVDGGPLDRTLTASSAREAFVRTLTAEIEDRLRAVTLNFDTIDAQQRNRALASQLERIFRGVERTPEVWQPHAPLGDQVSIARRIEDGGARLGSASPEITARVDALLGRLDAFHSELRHNHFSAEDLAIGLGVREGSWFVVREAAVALVAGPIALWGWVNHWIPFNLARVVALRRIESAADPAMNTILYGIALVLLVYAAQGALIWALLGPIAALLYVASLPIAAEINFTQRERLHRVFRRARAYLRFRGDRALQARLTGELRSLRADTLAVEALLASQPEGARHGVQ